MMGYNLRKAEIFCCSASTVLKRVPRKATYKFWDSEGL